MPDNPQIIVPIDSQPATTRDIDKPVPTSYLLIAINRLEKILGPLSRKIADITKPVDEYSITGEYNQELNVTTVTVFPQYDKSVEKISFVLVTGPPSTAFTLTLGDRTWSLMTDATGTWSIHGAGIMLDKNSPRVLVGTQAENEGSAVPSPWTLELTGYADERFYAP